jgi:hypothetical protein
LNEKRTASAREAARSVENQPLAVTLDDDLAIMVDVTVAIMTSPDHDGLVAIPRLALTDHFPVAITIAVTMTSTHGDASGADTDADFFSARRHRERNSSHRDGSHQKTLDHRMFLSMKLSGQQFAGM